MGCGSSVRTKENRRKKEALNARKQKKNHVQLQEEQPEENRYNGKNESSKRNSKQTVSPPKQMNEKRNQEDQQKTIDNNNQIRELNIQQDERNDSGSENAKELEYLEEASNKSVTYRFEGQQHINEEEPLEEMRENKLSENELRGCEELEKEIKPFVNSVINSIDMKQEDMQSLKQRTESKRPSRQHDLPNDTRKKSYGCIEKDNSPSPKNPKNPKTQIQAQEKGSINIQKDYQILNDEGFTDLSVKPRSATPLEKPREFAPPNITSPQTQAPPLPNSTKHTKLPPLKFINTDNHSMNPSSISNINPNTNMNSHTNTQNNTNNSFLILGQPNLIPNNNNMNSHNMDMEMNMNMNLNMNRESKKIKAKMKEFSRKSSYEDGVRHFEGANDKRKVKKIKTAKDKLRSIKRLGDDDSIDLFESIDKVQGFGRNPIVNRDVDFDHLQDDDDDDHHQYQDLKGARDITIDSNLLLLNQNDHLNHRLNHHLSDPFDF